MPLNKPNISIRQCKFPKGIKYILKPYMHVNSRQCEFPKNVQVHPQQWKCQLLF